MEEPRPTRTRYIRWVPSVPLMKRIGRLQTGLYRATRGWVGGRSDGLDILLLTTTGRRSGLARTSPLPYFLHQRSYVVVASFGGSERHPDWYHNLATQPEVALQVGALRLIATARTAEGELRDRLWREITAKEPRYDEYQARTRRRIPLVVLDPESTP